MNPTPPSAAEASRRTPDSGLALPSVGPRSAAVTALRLPTFAPSHLHTSAASRPSREQPDLRPPPSAHRLPTTDHRPPTAGLRPLASGSRASRGAAFTLIELMVAAGITTLLLLGMTGIFDQSMKAWRLSSRRADAEREVRAALSMIQRDFSSLIVQSEIPIYRVNSSVSAGFIGPSRTPDYSGSVASFFLTSPGSRAGSSGDVFGVGYYVAWDPDTRSFNLYRYFRNAPDQLTALTSFLRATPPIASRTGLFPANSEPDELVGANVVNFRMEYKTLPALFGNVSSQEGPVITNRPGYVQLELTAYGFEPVRGWTEPAQWLATTNIQKFGRTFLWRVDL